MCKGKIVLASVLLAIVLSMTVSSFVTHVFAQATTLSTTVPTGYVRIGAVADIDCKSGQIKQFDVMKKYNVKYYFFAGDYGYSNSQCVLDNIKNHGWSGANGNFAGSCGNHDSCSQLRTFNTGMTNNYGSKFFEDGKIAAHIFDGNTGLGVGSNQYIKMKSELEESDAWYNFAIIHQPFATAPTKHSANGQFDAWQPIFKENGVNAVLQGHNHNSQRFNISGMTYTTDGAGWHDSNGDLYEITGSSFKGNVAKFRDDSNNGFLLLDVKVDDPRTKLIKGVWMTDAEVIKDTFTIKPSVAAPPVPIDTDGDSIADDVDNCPQVANPAQTDSNNNGKGDACDPIVTPPPPDCPIGTAWDPITQECEPIPPPPEPTTGNETFTVSVGKGNVIFVPENATMEANVTVSVERGLAIMPAP